MKIVSFNVRCSYDGDGSNSFLHRAGLIYDKVAKELPDVIAFQEVTEPILNVMERLLPEYQFVGQFRNEDYAGEGVFTAIRKDTIALIGLETVWLSPTPYVAGSRYENQSICPRICVMTQLRHKTAGTLFRVFNLHLDHISDEARVLGMQSVMRFVEEYDAKRKLPVVILGDFNARPESKTIAFCEQYPGIREVTNEIPGSFHGFGKRNPPVKIDYIYLSEKLADCVEKTEAWQDVHEGIYLSDHYPLCAEVKL